MYLYRHTYRYLTFNRCVRWIVIWQVDDEETLVKQRFGEKNLAWWYIRIIVTLFVTVIHDLKMLTILLEPWVDNQHYICSSKVTRLSLRGHIRSRSMNTRHFPLSREIKRLEIWTSEVTIWNIIIIFYLYIYCNSVGVISNVLYSLADYVRHIRFKIWCMHTNCFWSTNICLLYIC